MTGYEDIIHLPHHVSVRHPQMSRQDRAAQFAPFAALTGHKDAIRETERLTERKRRLSEDCRQILVCIYGKYTRVRSHGKWILNILYRSEKGRWLLPEKVRMYPEVDTYLNEIVLQSGDRIPLDEIVDIDE